MKTKLNLNFVHFVYIPTSCYLVERFDEECDIYNMEFKVTIGRNQKRWLTVIDHFLGNNYVATIWAVATLNLCSLMSVKGWVGNPKTVGAKNRVFKQ